MKLTMRAKMLGKKVTLISTAFVLAVSTLTAVVPFAMAKQASAITSNCENEFSAVYQKCVNNITELNAAIANTAVTQIILNDTIETTVPVLITRPLLLNGHDEKIKFVGAEAADWQGNFVVKVFNTTGVKLNSLVLEGGDAGLQVNNSEVAISGNMRFINHEFGNIELTKSSNASLTRAPKLSVASQATLAGDNNTTVSKPYLWVANNAVSDAVVSDFLYRGLNRTKNSDNSAQHWYFANRNLTGVVATVLNSGSVKSVHASAQDAIDAASSGDVVLLNENTGLDTALVINKAITFDGGNKTLTANYSHTGTASDNGKKNTVVVVASDNVTVKSLTTDNTADGQKPHGIVVDKKDGIVLDNLTLKNGRAGAILNKSKVVATNISTVNNSWYGINVDGADSMFSISGQNNHDSGVYAIYAEDKANVHFTVDGQYARIENPVDNSKPALTNDVAYVLKSAVPKATVSVDGATGSVVTNDKTNVVRVSGTVESVNDVKIHFFKVKVPGVETELDHRIDSSDRNVSFNLRNVKNIPLDSKGRVKEGEYRVRYVAFDANNVRNDVVASEMISLTVDNTAPTADVILSEDEIVSNSALPTVTINGTDNATGISKVEYKIVRADDQDVTVVGWTEVQNNAPTTLSALGSIPDGNYAIAAAVYDGAGNRYRHEVILFTINRKITATFSVSSLRTATPTLNGTLNYSNGAPVASEALVITVDNVPYHRTTSATGAWDVTLSGVTSDTHYVTVALNGVGVVVDTDFETQLTTVTPGGTGTPVINPAPASTTTTVTVPVTPAINNFAASVLGLTDSAIPAADNNGAAEVKGTSTLDNLAQAVDADNTDGKAMGLAWYWWLLIAAGAALVLWWIIAAVRRRGAEA